MAQLGLNASGRMGMAAIVRYATPVYLEDSMWIAFLTLAAAQDCHPQPMQCVEDPNNLIKEQPYTLVPAPNSGERCTQNDDRDLTDTCVGDSRSEGSVGWLDTPAVRMEFEVDPGCLGSSCEPIHTVGLHLHKDTPTCPLRIDVEVTEIGNLWRRVRTWGPQGGSCDYIPIEVNTRGEKLRLTVFTDEGTFFLDEVRILAGEGSSQTNYLPPAIPGDTTAVQRVHPWGPMPRAEAPESMSDPVALQMLRGETRSVTWALTNGFDNGVVSVLRPLEQDETELDVSLNWIAPVETVLFDQRADAIAPPRSNQFYLYRGTAAHVLLDVHTTGETTLGAHDWTARIGLGGPLPVHVEVLGPILPDTSDTFFDWSYSLDSGRPFDFSTIDNNDGDEPDRDDTRQAARMTNAMQFLVPVPDRDGRYSDRDFDNLVTQIQAWPDESDILLLMSADVPARRDMQHVAPFPTDAWRGRTHEWVRTVVQRLVEDYDINEKRLVISPLDSPDSRTPILEDDGNGGTRESERYSTHEVYREMARIILDQPYKIRLLNTGSNPHDLMTLVSCRDDERWCNRDLQHNLGHQWAPNWDAYFDDDDLAAFVGERKAAGQPVFLVDGSELPNKLAHPTYDARMLPWQVRAEELDGYGYHFLYAPAGSGWDPFDVPGADLATAYAADRRECVDPLLDECFSLKADAMPSRRLLALRRGIDDYRILEYLEQLVEFRQGRSDYSTSVLIAENVLADAATLPWSLGTHSGGLDDPHAPDAVIARARTAIVDLAPTCNDGIDQDDDGLLDRDDPDCTDPDGDGEQCDAIRVLIDLGYTPSRTLSEIYRSWGICP